MRNICGKDFRKRHAKEIYGRNVRKARSQSDFWGKGGNRKEIGRGYTTKRYVWKKHEQGTCERDIRKKHKKEIGRGNTTKRNHV